MRKFKKFKLNSYAKEKTQDAIKVILLALLISVGVISFFSFFVLMLRGFSKEEAGDLIYYLGWLFVWGGAIYIITYVAHFYLSNMEEVE